MRLRRTHGRIWPRRVRSTSDCIETPANHCNFHNSNNRFVVILLARLRLTAEQALVHLIELGQTVFVESDVLEGGPRFDLEKLRASVSKILNQQQNGISDTSLMFEDNQSTEDHNQTDQTYA